MKKLNEEVKLKNRYTNDIVYCRNIKEVVTTNGLNFIKVYNKTNPQRVYLANREAFDLLK